MSAPGERAPSRRPWVRRVAGSLAAQLFVLLFAVLVVVLGLVGALNVRLHRHDLEQATLRSAERISHVLFKTMSYSMLRNDRETLREMVANQGQEEGIVSIRILNNVGKVAFSTDPSEVGTVISTESAECRGCHAEGDVRATLARSERFLIHQNGSDRVLGVITPIANAPSCSQADCHAHPASQQVLGLLDTNLSLATADASLVSGMWRMIAYSVVAILLVAGLSGLFMWLLVHTRVHPLRLATRRLAAGELGYQVPARGSDELAELAGSFNLMSTQLHQARQEITEWTRTLEQRVEEKTAQLRAAHVQVMQAEKLASLGKMAAVVAHEINNPLSGILTYARLLRRWLGSAETAVARLEESREAAHVIESESRRCGDIVRNLLSFSRSAPLHLAPTHLRNIVDACTRLLGHKLEHSGIALTVRIGCDLPPVHGDASQLEQLLLALSINAVEAMPEGGNLVFEAAAEDGMVRLTVADDGPGIPPDVLEHIFEPFVTTKEGSGGVGLGLAISRGIVERHGGTIDVDSQVGRGTRFTIRLPVEPEFGGAAGGRE